MTTPPPNDFPRELLAAYVDGELDADARLRVERWLADHPEARGELNAQRAASPANNALWERADPPEPSAGAWVVRHRAVQVQLAAPVSTHYRRAGIWAIAGLAAAGVAAAMAWVAFGPATSSTPPVDTKPSELARDLPRAPFPREGGFALRSDDLLAGMAVLPMATDDEVVLDRVPDFPTGWLPIGRHPLQGVMALASEQELLLAELGPSAIRPTGPPKMTTAPGDAPMLFSPRLR